jgi:pimeloyl-ACP methyl ester carboxylesterase
MRNPSTSVWVALLVGSSSVLAAASAGSGTALRTQSVALATGITLRYVEAGPATGEPVILLHGVTDTSRSFLETIDALRAIDGRLRLFAPDARGHGGSSLPAEAGCPEAPERCFEIADHAADVLAFMDRQHLRRVHLVGHSMGNAVAQHVALAHPDRVASLVLIGGFATGADNAVINGLLLSETIEGRWKAALQGRPGFRWPADAYRLTPLDADPGAEEWNRRNWVVDPVADPALVRAIVPETARTRLGTWIGSVRALAAFDNRAALAHLRVPTLVIWATQDNAFPEEPDQARLRASLGAAAAACRTTWFFKTYGKEALPASGQQESDLGHNVQWGAPEAVAADIASFVRTGRPTADLPYADPRRALRVSIDRGAADVEAHGCAVADTRREEGR